MADAHDFSGMTKEQLDAEIAKEKQKSSYDFSGMSKDQLDAEIAKELEGQSITGKILSGVEAIGKGVDKYTGGASTRAFLDQALRTTPEFGKPAPGWSNLSEGAEAAKKVFTEPGYEAPTGKEIAHNRLGFSDQSAVTIPHYAFGNELPEAQKQALKAQGKYEPALDRYQVGTQESASPAGVVGTGIDLAANPTNFIPVGKIIGKGTEALGSIAKAGLRALPGAETTEAITKNTSNIIKDIFKPTQSKDLPEYLNILKENNIPTENIPVDLEFGKNKALSKLSKANNELGLVESRTNDHVDFLNQISHGIDNKISQISGGEVLGRADAGVHLQDAYDRSIDNLFSDANIRYSTIGQQYGDIPLSSKATIDLHGLLDDVTKGANKTLSRNLTSQDASQAKMLLNAVDVIKREGNTLGGATDVLQNLGEVAYKNKYALSQTPPDIKRTQDLYKGLREAITDSIKENIPQGDKIASALSDSNQKISQFLKDQEPIQSILQNTKLAPEQIFDRITKNSSQIDSLKAILAPEDFQKLKGAYLDNIIKRNPDRGYIEFGSLRAALENKKNQEVISRLFDPQEMQSLGDLIKVGNASGTPELLGPLNRSSELIKDLPQKFLSTLVNEHTIDNLKNAARARSAAGLTLPAEAAKPTGFFTSRGLGVKAIGPKEAVGIRLPQEYYLQQQNQKRGR